MNLNNEIKKLNFALDSYKQCNYHAEYIETDDSVIIKLKDSFDVEVMKDVFIKDEFLEDNINNFKREAINKCSHVKKEENKT